MSPRLPCLHDRSNAAHPPISTFCCCCCCCCLQPTRDPCSFRWVCSVDVTSIPPARSTAPDSNAGSAENAPIYDRSVERFESAPIEDLVADSTFELTPKLNAARKQLRLHLIIPVLFCAIIFIEIANDWQSSIAITALIFFRYYLTVSLKYNLRDDQIRKFERLSNSFHQLMRSRRTWRIPMEARESDWKRHAGASSTVERKPISLSVGTPALIKSNIEFLCVPLRNKSLYLTPDSILIIGGNSVAALRYDDLDIGCTPTRVIESEQVPDDAELVGESWQYVNKNGTPDRRFGNNRKLPICLYAQIDFKSTTGLNERVQCSRLAASEEFVGSTVAMRHSDGTSITQAQPPSDKLDLAGVFAHTGVVAIEIAGAEEGK
jgi:hypothetical protein